MAILNVNGVPFNYPDPGSEPGWGEDATGWAKAINTLTGGLYAPGDILPTSTAITNNVSAATSISGMKFDITKIREATITYNIQRSSTTTLSGVTEGGQIVLVYNDITGIFTLTQTGEGDAGVVFSITSLGQMQYISSDIGSTNNSGKILFSAKVLNK